MLWALNPFAVRAAPAAEPIHVVVCHISGDLGFVGSNPRLDRFCGFYAGETYMDGTRVE